VSRGVRLVEEGFSMTNAPPPESDGGDLVLHEIRDEVSALAHHPVEETKRLAHVAGEGESPTTPLLATFAVIVVVGAVLAVMLTAALLVYFLS
jgi:hypothetical protein